MIWASASLAADDDRPGRSPGTCSPTTRKDRRGDWCGRRRFHCARLPPGGLSNAGYRVLGITSRSIEKAREVAAFAASPGFIHRSMKCSRDPAIGIMDVAVPPAAQPGLIHRLLDRVATYVGSWPRNLWPCHTPRPSRWSTPGSRPAWCSRSTRTCGMIIRSGPSRPYWVAGVLGEPVLATIEMRAIPHWMPWAEGDRSLSTFIMSIHHLDTFRYWLGDPVRVLASTRPDPRTQFPHADGINLYVLEYASGARASSWDDVWAGPREKGRARRRRCAGGSRAPRGCALARSAGRNGQDKYPAPSTIRRFRQWCLASTPLDGAWFPMLSPARWAGCCSPWKQAGNRTFGPGQLQNDCSV